MYVGITLFLPTKQKRKKKRKKKEKSFKLFDVVWCCLEKVSGDLGESEVLIIISVITKHGLQIVRFWFSFGLFLSPSLFLSIFFFFFLFSIAFSSMCSLENFQKTLAKGSKPVKWRRAGGRQGEASYRQARGNLQAS